MCSVCGVVGKILEKYADHVISHVGIAEFYVK